MAREIENQDELGILPSNKEIKKHLRKLKTHKAPGMNGVPTECYKLLGMGGGFSNAGHHFYDFIWEYWRNPELDPQEIHEVRLVMLPKSGDLSNQNKWQGICLLDITSKIVSSIIADRLRKHLLTFGIDEQCGHVGCADANFSIWEPTSTVKFWWLFDKILINFCEKCWSIFA